MRDRTTMNGTRTLVAAFVSVSLVGCNKGDSTTTVPDAPMASAQQIPISLVSNYGFMGQMMSKGDGRSFASFYSDSAELVRVGYKPLQGQAAIRAFVRNGDVWGVLEWTRMSEGFTVDGRDVIDSGTYVLTTAQLLPANSLDPKGKYRTHWTYTTKGGWLILSDSLFGLRK